jgi:hypothetical protein
VLGVGAVERCGSAVAGSMGKSKWTEWVWSAVGAHCRQHLIRCIEAKLAVPLAEAAAPEALVGHARGAQAGELAAAFGHSGWGGVLAGLVTGYNAGRLTWSAEYDDEARQGPEGLGVADMRHAPVRPRSAWRGRCGRRGAPRGVARAPAGIRGQGAPGVVPEWPADDGQVARERANQRRRRPCGCAVWQGGPGGPGAHCSTCAGTAETTMYTYLHYPLHCAPRVRFLQAVDAW